MELTTKMWDDALESGSRGWEEPGLDEVRLSRKIEEGRPGEGSP